MKVWVLNDFEHGEVYVYDDTTDVLNIPLVKNELGYLEGDEYLEDEKTQFLAEVSRAQMLGRGSASIEERFSIELQEVR